MSNRSITSISSLIVSVAIICVAGLTLKPRLTDFRLAYDYVTGQIFSDIRSVGQPSVESDEKWKEGSPAELNKRLMSIDPNLRLRAITAIEEKSDPQFIPQMIRLLNDDTPAVGPLSTDTFKISDAAKKALTKLIRDGVVREPENMALFLPLFQAVYKGSGPEKLGVIEILATIREPTTRQLLEYLSKDRENPQLASNASISMRSLIPDSVAAPEYHSLTSRRIDFMYLLMASGIVMAIAAVLGLIKGKGARFAFLCILAVVVDVGLGVLVHAELNRGNLTQRTLAEAAKTRDVLALRTMSYSDYTPYPGDSYFCQQLVQLGDPGVIKSLIMVPNLEPDDLSYVKKDFQIRMRWIIARIIMLNLGRPSLDSIINCTDPEVVLAVAKTLNEIKVSNTEIKEYLARLAKNEGSEKVRELAAQALSKTKSLPTWPSN